MTIEVGRKHSSAVFINFFKGARLRFQEIGGEGVVKPGCKVFC